MSESAESAEPTNIPSASDPQAVANQTSLALLVLKQGGNSGANWFFWIAGLSLVNTAMIHGGGDLYFIIGLAVTVVVDAVAQSIGKEHPESATLAMGIAIAFSLCAAVVVSLFGWLSRKRLPWVFGIGMALYLLDGVLYLILKDFLSTAFHGYALFWMYQGFGAYRKLEQLETALRTPQ